MSDILKPIPLKLSTDLLAKIKYAADRLGISQQDTMREAIRIGLKQWARIGYDTAGAVLDAPTAYAKAPTAAEPLTEFELGLLAQAQAQIQAQTDGN